MRITILKRLGVVKKMPKRKDIETILVIGSGPIIIGQAAEFDYAGTQACLSLREEGYKVILVNSNPATIMTRQHRKSPSGNCRQSIYRAFDCRICFKNY